MKASLIAALGMLLAACGQPENATIQALIGGKLIDGRGGAAVEPAVVIVESGKFRAAGLQSHVPIPAGSRKIDTTGMVLRPSEPGGRILPGDPANLELVAANGNVLRRMLLGVWQ